MGGGRGLFVLGRASGRAGGLGPTVDGGAHLDGHTMCLPVDVGMEEGLEGGDGSAASMRRAWTTVRLHTDRMMMTMAVCVRTTERNGSG